MPKISPPHTERGENTGEHGRPKGVALFVTLLVVSLLVTVVIEANRKIRSAVVATAAVRDRYQLGWAAASGVEAAMAVLVADRNTSQVDSLQEDWADPEKLALLVEELPFEGVKLTLTITDELGKIQINALVRPPHGQEFNPAQRELWDRLLRPIVSQDETADINATTDMIHSAKDWLDSEDDDAITGLNGAESDYYQSLDPPYTCRNGPFEHIGELAMVKGFSRQLLYGMETVPGIAPYLTVYGGYPDPAGKTFSYTGKININTAPLPVLAALLPPDYEDLAQSIAAYREERDGTVFVNDLSAPNWYTNAPGCADIKIGPELITTSSDFFRIECSAMHDSQRRTVTVVVRREMDKKTNKWKCRIVSWEAGMGSPGAPPAPADAHGGSD